MRKKHVSKKWYGLLIALVVLLFAVAPLYAEESINKQGDNTEKGGLLQLFAETFSKEETSQCESDGIQFYEVDDDEVSVSLLDGQDETVSEDVVTEESAYKDSDIVRVSIVLDGKSTMEKGYELMDIAENDAAMDYREKVRAEQETVTNRIERKLDEELDVEWNLTLTANIISANVEYGQIETIANVRGVKTVEIENQHFPEETVDTEDVAVPQMELADSMTGATAAWTAGYTGAGTRIAVIDTGADPDHQSFDAEAFDYALQQVADANGVTVESYDLLDIEELEEKKTLLNVQGKLASTGQDLFVSNKIAFGFNYVDHNYNITHDLDTQTDHGSHVSGIATANRYIETSEGVFEDALTVCKVAGNAPDAQLLVMKVFGEQGGAYDSDYMAAIEDAIILGADSVNLSLGTEASGFSQAGIYQHIMDNIVKSGTVVCSSAGNSGNWNAEARTKEYLGKGYSFTDSVQFNTMGFPGTYTNMLSVASVENSGQISNAYFQVSNENGEDTYTGVYNETIYNSMKPFTSLDTSNGGAGTTYEYVFVDGFGKEGDLDGIDVTGKIFICKRGDGIAFYEKANYGVEHGAIATIVYNNVDGSAGMDMTDYKKEQPAVMITKQAGEAIQERSALVEKENGDVYWTGTMKVVGTATVFEDENNYSTMSDFSSWGATGDLALKPEITAPGGNIYSVRGDDPNATNKYKLNSGTSMASPQVAGISAVISQFIEKTNFGSDTDIGLRQLNQSLLMSTAEPLKDKDGNYYPVLQQGAGLAHAGNAVNADSFIMMGEDATPSYADGKVKAELGDDPEKTGIYEFSFDLYNISDETKTFDMSADVFIQDYFEDISNKGSAFKAYYMKNTTKSLDAVAIFMENGIAQVDGTVDVPAKGKTTVKARIQISDAGKEVLEKYYSKGTYIQAYVFAKPKANAEGLVTSAHSIPVLAFYGNWTDVPMFDGGSYKDGELISYYCTEKTTDDSRSGMVVDGRHTMDPVANPESGYTGTNHMIVTVDGNTYAYGGNPLVADETYYPERDAFSSNLIFERWNYMPLRDYNFWKIKIENLTANEVYVDTEQSGGQHRSGYYSKSSMLWQGGVNTVGYRTELTGKIKAGDEIEISLQILPEYYCDYAMGANATPGSGSVLSVKAKVDGSTPQVERVEYNDGKLTINAADNYYISGAVLYNENGTEILDYVGSVQNSDVKPGDYNDYVLDMRGEGSGEYLVQIFDYAMNAATYRIELNQDVIAFSGSMLGFDLENDTWVQVDPLSDKIPAVTEKTRVYTAASAVGDMIYAVAYNSQLYGLSVANPESSAKIGEIGYSVVDMAYNATDGKMYGVTDNNLLVSIDMQTGRGAEVGRIPFTTNTLACDANGTFYSNLYGSGKVYSYTIDALKNANLSYDLNGDGVVAQSDAQALLDHVNGKSLLADVSNADLDNDSDVDTHDAYLLLDKIPGRVNLITDIGFASKYMQSMEVDPNNDTLYWMSYYTSMMGSTEVGFSALYEINAVTGETTRYQDVWNQLSSFVILDKHAGNVYEPVEGTNRDLESAKKEMAGNAEQAGIAVLNGVDNSAKNELLADEGKLVEIILKNSKASTNGLFTLTYDPAVMTFVSAKSEAELSSVAQTSESALSFAYANKKQFNANSEIAVLTFRVISCEANVSITEKEMNNEHSAVESTYDGGSHNWGEWAVTPATCIADGLKTATCTECKAEKTEVIPKDEDLHGFGEWTVTTPANGDDPGVESSTCAHCQKTVSRWILADGMETTDADPAMNVFGIYDHYVGTATVQERYLSSVSKLATSDGSMRYLVSLDSATSLDDIVHVDLTSWGWNGSGHGLAIKREIVDVVGWDADDLDYDIQLENGIGVLTAYSYNVSEYTLLKIYFMVGEQGGYGECSVIDVPGEKTSYWDGYIDSLGVLSTKVTKVSWEENIDDENKVINYTGYLYLSNTETDANEMIHLEFIPFESSGDAKIEIYSGHDMENHGENLRDSGLDVQLVNGKAKVELCSRYIAPDSRFVNHERYYTIYVEIPGNAAPSLAQGVPANASDKVKVGETFALDLDSVFIDANGDVLTYSVSVNGADAVAADAQYTFIPEEEGTVTLVFTADDGFLTSEPYTVTLKVISAAALYGDANGDGAVDLKDVTLLRRYVAGWENVSVDMLNADVNADGKVDLKDVTLLRRYVANWDVTLGQ